MSGGYLQLGYEMDVVLTYGKDVGCYAMCELYNCTYMYGIYVHVQYCVYTCT